MHKLSYKKLSLLVASMLLLSACGQFSIALQKPAADGSARAGSPLPTETIFEPANELENAQDDGDAPLDHAYLSRIVPFPPSGGSPWLVYDNTEHGFAFQYPQRWQLTEIPGENRSMAAASPWADTVLLENGIYQLMIWFNKTAEDRSFLQAVNGGDRENAGTFNMLGEDFPIFNVWENGVETTVLYGDEHFWIGDLHFSIALINLDRGQEAGLAIAPGVKREAEQILGSFVAASVDYTPPGPTTLSDDLLCDPAEESNSWWIICNVRDAFLSGNLSTLPHWMTDPFALGYWASEWTSRSPHDVIEELRTSQLPENLGSLTFTSNREQFPPLFGMPIEGMLGPDVKIEQVLYGEGWGSDGYGAALLLFGPDGAGETKLRAIVLSHQHFDK